MSQPILVGIVFALATIAAVVYVNRGTFVYSPSFPSLYQSRPMAAATNFSSVAVFVPVPIGSAKISYVRGAYAQMEQHPLICPLDQRTPSCQLAFVLRFIVGRGGTASGDTLVVDASDLDPADPNTPMEISSTTVKVLEGIKWAADQRTDYVLRQDADSHVNLLQLADRLRTAPRTKWIMGRFFYDGRVRESWLRHYLNLFVYPPYPSGMGWVMTGDVARHVAALENPILSYPEDAVFGLWIAGLRIIRESSLRFHNIHSRRLHGPCRKDDILTHYMTLAEWSNIHPTKFYVNKCI